MPAPALEAQLTIQRLMPLRIKGPRSGGEERGPDLSFVTQAGHGLAGQQGESRRGTATAWIAYAANYLSRR